MTNAASLEITVEQAAALLGVTPRSIINYIRLKEIEALKVGKSWFINRISLEAFQQRYGLSPRPGIESAPEIEKDAEVEIEAETEPATRRERRATYPVHGLRLFQIMRDTLARLDAHNWLPPDRPDLKRKLSELKFEALEYLGAGFYAYGAHNKAALYNRSREKVGGMLCLLYFHQSQGCPVPDDVAKIEEELMPAYSSLIRRIEKKNESA